MRSGRDMATSAYFSFCTLLLACSVLAGCAFVSGSDDLDATTVGASESSDFNMTTEASSAKPGKTVVGEKNTTENAAIVAGIRDVLSSLGMEVSPGGEGTAVTARVKMSKFFHPLMLVPGLIVWGFAPIAIAKLKWFVWQALMLNHMALMSAWYMTLRNIVFGPRPGNIVKYANHGYGPNRFYHYHKH